MWPGTYLIRRFYRASPERLAGHVVQSCQIQVPCDHVDLSRTGRMEDDAWEVRNGSHGLIVPYKSSLTQQHLFFTSLSIGLF